MARHNALTVNKNVSSGDKLTTHVSIKVRQVNDISSDAPNYSARIELSFAYDVAQYMSLRGRFLPDDKKRGAIEAEDIKIPFTLSNAVSLEDVSETHVFRDQNPAADDGWRSSLQATPSPGSCIKQETYNIIGTLGYHNSWAFTRPFDKVHLFVKLAILESIPNASDFHFVFDHVGSDFNGMKREGGAFFPNGTGPVVSTTPEDSRDAPKLYVSVEYRRHRVQSYVKFYLVPPMMFLLLVLRQLEDVSDILGLGATLVLANVALLFVSNNLVLTCEEQPVLLNTLTAIITSVILTQDLSSYDISFDTLSIALVAINTILTVAMFAGHMVLGSIFARKANKVVKSGDFDQIDRM